MKEKKLAALQIEYTQMIKDSETISLADTGESEESQVQEIHKRYFRIFSLFSRTHKYLLSILYFPFIFLYIFDW